MAKVHGGPEGPEDDEGPEGGLDLARLDEVGPAVEGGAAAVLFENARRHGRWQMADGRCVVASSCSVQQG